MFTKHEFVEYANTIRDYSNAMQKRENCFISNFLNLDLLTLSIKWLRCSLLELIAT